MTLQLFLIVLCVCSLLSRVIPFRIYLLLILSIFYIYDIHYYKMTRKSKKVLVVLRFYGPVNPMGSCRARSVYLTTSLMGRLSPLSGIAHILSPETDNCPS